MSDFGPQDDAEREVFAVEAFRVDVQHRIQTVMNRKNVSQKKLAERLGVSEARVSQIFSSRSNMTLRFLARVFFALDDECRLDSKEWDAYRVEKRGRELFERGPESWTAVPPRAISAKNDNAYAAKHDNAYRAAGA